MTKIKVTTNRGFLGCAGKGAEHHENKDDIGDFSKNALNLRTNWDYNVKHYHNSGDCYGATIISWEESPTGLAEAAAFLGGLFVGFGCGARKREYIAYFNSSTGEVISESEKDRIQTLNKDTIHKLLNKIDNLLDQSNEQEFDTDVAQEKLQEVFSKYQHIMSKKNSNRYKQLKRKQENEEMAIKDKLERMQKEILKNQKIALDSKKEILKELSAKNSQLTEMLKHAEKDREQKHREGMKRFNEVDKNIHQNRKEADRKFHEASKHRDEVYKQTQGDIEGLRLQADAHYEKAKKEREDIYTKTKEELQTVQENIKQASREANEKFAEAVEERKKINQEQRVKIQEIIDKNEAYYQEIDKNFKNAAKERQKIAERQKCELAEAKKEVLKSREQFKIEFQKSSAVRAKEYQEVVRHLSSIHQEQREGFKDAIKEQREIANKFSGQIQTFASKVERRFDEAIVDRERKQQAAQAKLEKVEREVLESRKQAEEKFNSAAQERATNHANTQAKLEQVEEEVLESRKQADAKFQSAFEHRQKIFSDTESNLHDLKGKVLQSRKEANAKFEEAQKHRDKIHQDTENKLEQVEEEVLESRKQAEAEFEKATLARDKNHEETQAKIDQVEQEVNTAREEVQHGFNEALEHREKHLQRIQMSQEKISAKMQEYDEKVVKLALSSNEKLRSREDEYRGRKKLIEEEKHEDIVNIKKVSTKQGLSPAEHEEVWKNLTKLHNKYNSTKNLQSLEKALKYAKKCAPYWNAGKYNFEEDKLGIKNKLTAIETIKYNQQKSDLKKQQKIKLASIQQEVAPSSQKIEEILKEFDKGFKAIFALEEKEEYDEAEQYVKDLLTKYEKIAHARVQKNVQLLSTIQNCDAEFSSLQEYNESIECSLKILQRIEQALRNELHDADISEGCRNLIESRLQYLTEMSDDLEDKLLDENINQLSNNEHVEISDFEDEHEVGLQGAFHQVIESELC